MKILIGFEESFVVTNEFLKKGHDAWSCDVQETRGDKERHYKSDIVKAITDKDWDMVILHPPCTAIAVSGNRWYGHGMPLNDERKKAVRWTWELWRFCKNRFKKAVMENPVGVLPESPNQYIQPWQFGHGETKKTGLWLHNLPELKPTNVVEGREGRVWRMAPGPDRARMRSETFHGIAVAMADQWG